MAGALDDAVDFVVLRRGQRFKRYIIRQVSPHRFELYLIVNRHEAQQQHNRRTEQGNKG
ncbi:hypothetical protein D3C81_2023060 [compost metagenome]